MTRFVALAVLFGAATVPAADPMPAVTHEFKVVTESDVKMEGEGLPSGAITLRNDIRYSWRRSGRERILRVHEMKMVAKVGGTEIRSITMSRAGMFGIEQEKKVERKYEDVPEALKRLLRDTFDAPICKLEVDETGKEVKRTIVAGPGAISADKWMSFTTSLGHPPYSADKKEWRSVATMNAGQGEASGELTYTKAAKGKGGQTVKVTGVLRPDAAKKDENVLRVSDGTYTVSGTRTYDPDRKEWVSGTLDIDVAITLAKGDKNVGTGKGTMKLIFELVPEKK